MAKTAKRVSFYNSSKIVEITSDDEVISSTMATIGTLQDSDNFDPDTMPIDLTRGGKPKWNQSVTKGNDAVPYLETSLANVPWHLPLLLYTIMADGSIMNDTRYGLQQAFYGLIVLHLIYSVMIQEKAKIESNPVIKSSGPTHWEFLYTSTTLPISILLSLPIYFTFVLLGAPVGPLNALTFYLACHVSVIAFFPLLNCYKLNGKRAKNNWWKILTFQVDSWKFNQLYCSSLGALLGCWLGVSPIPLDWDRDWQEWPITLIFGAYTGGFLGGLLSYFYGKWAQTKIVSKK
ncbi:mannose-ethanolamine phosphotransferase [Martiniozyma asiatica (nom. inval.)]|nr:mannose-ethanolamine phosphotransferase [Martiniozyma asiatica]